MAKARVLHGSRAKIFISGNLVGLFANCTWSIRQTKQPIFILGRFHPAEIVPLSQEPVTMSLSGYRVVDAGPYKVANATLLKNLLNEEDFEVRIEDRQSGKTIFSAVGCRVQGWSSGVAANRTSDINVDIIGIKGEDEAGIASGGDDDTTAVKLDDGT
jgi:hypothetical protein